MRLVVASGKGGTGKTLVATNLAWSLAARGAKATYVDADVEAPNGHLFLPPDLAGAQRYAVPVPTLVVPHCSGCGACAEACQFGAIVAGTDGVTVYPDLCHSCGVCVRACPEAALGEVPRETGTLRRGHAGPGHEERGREGRGHVGPGHEERGREGRGHVGTGHEERGREGRGHVGRMGFVDGTLDPGETRAAPLIQATVALGRREGCTVIDAPPGTSCSAVAAVEDADLVLLVCEPTPFGLHDLALSLQMCEHLGLETRAVINRSDVGDDGVRSFLADEGVPVVAEIPFDRRIATACATGVLAYTRVPSFASTMDALADRLFERCEDRP